MACVESVKQAEKVFQEQRSRMDKKEKEKKDLMIFKTQLNRDVKDLEDEVDYLEKQSSIGRAARKMFGDISPGDYTYEYAISHYKSYFKEMHKNLPKAFKESNKHKIWEMGTDIVLMSFDATKMEMAEFMKSEIKEILTRDKIQHCEDTTDVLQAFKMLLAARAKSSMTETMVAIEAKKNLQKCNDNDLDDAIQLALMILFELPPEQHLSAIKMYPSVTSVESKYKAGTHDDTLCEKCTRKEQLLKAGSTTRHCICCDCELGESNMIRLQPQDTYASAADLKCIIICKKCL